MNTNEYKEKLDAIKQKKKPNQSEIKSAVDYLMYALSDDEYDYFAESVMKLKYKICDDFFSKFKLDSERADKIVDALNKCRSFTENQNNCAITRAVIIIASMLKQNIAPEITIKLALPFILASQKSDSAFSSATDGFNKYIMRQELSDKFYALSDFSEKHKSKFEVFAARIKKSELSEQECNSVKQDSDTKNRSEVTAKEPPEKQVPKNNAPAEPSPELALKLNTIEKDISKLLALCSEIPTLKINAENYRQALLAKDNEIKSLNEDKRAQMDKIDELQKRLEASNRQIHEIKERNEALNNELKKAFEIDNSNKDQAIITLKEKIADALKLEYAQLQEIDNEVDEDNYIAMRSSLVRIFKILKRFDINAEKV